MIKTRKENKLRLNVVNTVSVLLSMLHSTFFRTVIASIRTIFNSYLVKLDFFVLIPKNQFGYAYSISSEDGESGEVNSAPLPLMVFCRLLQLFHDESPYHI